VAATLAEKQPVISVDTKKKELVGDFRNNGREDRPQGNPEEVRVHDFLIKELGRAVPYGVYDLAANTGWVSVGVDHDTAALAVNSIRQWWLKVGRARYPDASRLLVTADGGGSNALGSGCGYANFRNWPTNSASTSWSATCLPAPASGTKLSTASSPSSARIGAPSPLSAIG
jgi:hypothetical protein